MASLSNVTTTGLSNEWESYSIFLERSLEVLLEQPPQYSDVQTLLKNHPKKFIESYKNLLGSEHANAPQLLFLFVIALSESKLSFDAFFPYASDILSGFLRCIHLRHNHDSVLPFIKGLFCHWFDQNKEGLWEFLSDKNYGNFLLFLDLFMTSDATCENILLGLCNENKQSLEPIFAHQLCGMDSQWHPLILDLTRSEINARIDDWTILETALVNYDWKLALFLVQNGADLNSLDNIKLTPLQRAFVDNANALDEGGYIFQGEDFRSICLLLLTPGKGETPYSHLTSTFIELSNVPPEFLLLVELAASSIARGGRGIEEAIVPHIFRLASLLSEENQKRLIEKLLDSNLRHLFSQLLFSDILSKEERDAYFIKARQKGLNISIEPNEPVRVTPKIDPLQDRDFLINLMLNDCDNWKKYESNLGKEVVQRLESDFFDVSDENKIQLLNVYWNHPERHLRACELSERVIRDQNMTVEREEKIRNGLKIPNRITCLLKLFTSTGQNIARDIFEDLPKEEQEALIEFRGTTNEIFYQSSSKYDWVRCRIARRASRDVAAQDFVNKEVEWLEKFAGREEMAMHLFRYAQDETHPFGSFRLADLYKFCVGDLTKRELLADVPLFSSELGPAPYFAYLERIKSLFSE